jgi:hypothetical protein
MEKDHLEYLDVDGRIKFKRIFSKWDVVAWTGLIWHMMGTGGGHM